jgi:hypothetical protein
MKTDEGAARTIGVGIAGEMQHTARKKKQYGCYSNNDAQRIAR